MDSRPVILPREEALALMQLWLRDLSPLESLRRRMPEGATLEDALRLHRKIAQVGRQPSRVMQEEGDNG